MLHKSKLGISAENIIKMFDITDAGQKAEKRPLSVSECKIQLVGQVTYLKTLQLWDSHNVVHAKV